MFVLHCSVMHDSFATPWTVACQAPLPMEFSRQEYWSGLPFPPPGDVPTPGIKPASLVSPALAGRFFTTVPPGKPTLEIAYFQKLKGKYISRRSSVQRRQQGRLHCAFLWSGCQGPCKGDRQGLYTCPINARAQYEGSIDCK